MVSRRRFLAAGAALGAARCFGQSVPDLLPAPGGRRVVIVGGGWGGLTAARHLRRLAPELEVLLIDRDTAFRSLPLSNSWLVDRTPDAPLQQDYATAARAWGYGRCGPKSPPIDRERRRLHTAQGALGYDWLILAAGIRHDYGPWLGGDARAIEATRRLYPAGFLANELDALKQKLADFRGGDLLMTVPPPPLRCPPAPYERAVMIAWLLKTRRIRGRLVLVDAGGGMQRFNRMFAERYKDQVLHLTHAPVKSIDPFNKTLSTEFDQLKFDDAIIIPAAAGGGPRPPGGAGRGRCRGHAGRLGRHSIRCTCMPSATSACSSSATCWAAPRPCSGTTRRARTWPPGSVASPPRKSPRVRAARCRSRTFPESVCHVYTDIEPPEMLRIDAQYRAARRRPDHPDRAPARRPAAARGGPAVGAGALRGNAGSMTGEEARRPGGPHRQSSSCSPLTRLNSPVFEVTTTKPRASAVPAISTS
jgi:hypothetical protein